MFFAVVEFEPKNGGPRSHLACGSVDADPGQIALEATWQARGFEPVHVVAVNMNRILARVRDNARRAGFDLDAAFLPAPSDPRLAAILKPYTELRDEAIQRVMKAKHDKEDLARRAGLVARAIMEAVDELPRRSWS